MNVNDKRRVRARDLGIRYRCPADCYCICHDTGGSGHEHVGQPCPGKYRPRQIDER